MTPSSSTTTTETASDGFPRELLVQPPADRLAYFAAKVVAHPRLMDAHRAVHDALRQPTPPSLIVLYGPTGVGKTTLRLRLEQQLITEALPALEKDTARVPVLAVEAIAPESGQFNWKDYYARALVALNEPLLDRKVMVNAAVNPDAVRPTIRRSASAPALRWVLEQCLRQRRVGVCLIDEAQHLKRLASGRRLLDQMDTLKSLAATTGTVHVLVGTYELLGLTNLSAQLSRRTVEIHFGRYRASVDKDRLAFKSVLLTFQRHLPVSEEPDLVGLWERLYEGSLGCVGVLKSWLNRALADAIAHESTTITRRHLDRQALPTRTLLNLAREITEGEAVLREDPKGRDQLRSLLGLPTTSISRTRSGTGQATRDRTSRSRRTGRVARRPTRDLVAMEVGGT
jgi:energy-coupling factor transporter ATP-binding protein EcfA2